ncbi:MAG: glycosyltransferase family 4 protein [Acidimicrobiales bacterium]
MKVAFVTPRYGEGVIGGAETAIRMLAEHLCRLPGWEVEVLTSCALDRLMLANTEPDGTTVTRGVTVSRFPTEERSVREHVALDSRLRVSPSTATVGDSMRWLELNGPTCPGLSDAVRESNADVVVCSPYLFATTTDSVAVSRVPVVVHPAAHDEPALYLPVFATIFRHADGFVYYTGAERVLVDRAFRAASKPQIVLGLGIGDQVGAGRAGGDLLGIGERPYLCYVGRVDEHKGCRMLEEYFIRYKLQRKGDLALAFVGPVSERAPSHPDIVVTGAVAEPDKWDILAGAELMVNPSANESFSLVLLESWSVGVPVLVNSACGATMEHCRRSGGGLWFDSYRSFEVTIDRMVTDRQLRGRLGDAGQRYVHQHFRWSTIIERYGRFLQGVSGRGRSNDPGRLSPVLGGRLTGQRKSRTRRASRG